LIGRHIVEFEQQGKQRTDKREELLQRVTQDLSAKFGRGLSYPNLTDCRTKFSPLNTAPYRPMNNSSPMRLRKRATIGIAPIDQPLT
jgi:hypothetical protein